MKETITIVGNLGGDPERRTTGAGAAFAAFSVGCTNRRWVADSRTWVDEATNWYRVAVFRALGEHALASLRKGQRVVVTGRLQIRSWEGAGGKQSSADITADALGHDLLFGTTTFHATPREQPDAAPPAAVGAPAAVSDSWAVPGAPEDADEPVPF